MSAKRWIFFFFALLVVPVRLFTRRSKTISRLVVFQMAKLGDMVCTTPVFRAIKRALPESHLSVVGNAINKDVLRGNGDIDDYLAFDGIFSMFRKLSAKKIEVAVLVGPDLTSLTSAYLAGIPFIVVPRIEGGYSPFESLPYRLLRSLPGITVVPHRIGQYAPREYLRTLEPLGIKAEDTTKHLAVSEDAERAVVDFLAAHGIPTGALLVGISPSAGNKIKKWEEKNFAQLALQLKNNHGATIIVVGGRGDRKEVENFFQHLPSDPMFINASEKLNIEELKALIKKMNLFVAVDTGPIYIAEAFGVPTVDIVGPMDEKEQPPQGKQHRVITPPGSRIPQLHIMNARKYDEKEAKRQVESISVSMVYKACKELLLCN